MPEIKNFPALCKSLAVEMTARTGELWRVIEDAERWTHIESPSACLQLRDDWRTHRLAIHATAPSRMREMTTGETITADPTRTPEAIARDICNRLLNHARAHLAESKAYDREKMLEANAKKLRESMIKRYCPEQYNGKFASGKKADLYRERVWAELTYNNLVNIEINVTMGEALKLLKLLTQGK
jgi:hypothetical protein